MTVIMIVCGSWHLPANIIHCTIEKLQLVCMCNMRHCWFQFSYTQNTHDAHQTKTSNTYQIFQVLTLKHTKLITSLTYAILRYIRNYDVTGKTMTVIYYQNILFVQAIHLYVKSSAAIKTSLHVNRHTFTSTQSAYVHIYSIGIRSHQLNQHTFT